MPTRGLVDTSVFVAGEAERPLDVDALPDEMAVSVVTVGELRAGVLVAASGGDRARRLRTLTRVLALDPVPVDTAVAEAWADFRLLLREHGLRMPVNDSWIAATALALGVPVVTQDGDYPAVGGLRVVRA